MINKNLNIVALEIDIIWGDKDANLLKLEQNLQIIPSNTDLVVLPELFSTGFLIENPTEMRNISEKNTEKTIKKTCKTI